MQLNRPNPGHRAEIRTDLDRPMQRHTISLPDDSGQIYQPNRVSTSLS